MTPERTYIVSIGGSYLSCDEWTTGIYCRSDEVDELALVLTVDFTVELCKPMRVGLQSCEGLCMSVKHTHTTHTDTVFQWVWLMLWNVVQCLTWHKHCSCSHSSPFLLLSSYVLLFLTATFVKNSMSHIFLIMQYLHIDEVGLEHGRHSGLQVVKAGLRAIACHFDQPWKLQYCN